MNMQERMEAIRTLMPRTDGYRHYPSNTAENIKKIIVLIKNEPNKKQQFAYFGKLMDKTLDFLQTLSFATYNDGKKGMDGSRGHNRTEVLGMLRALKRLHFDIDYRPGRMSIINQYVKQFGGTVQTKEQMQEKKNEKLRAAAEKLATGAKMSRKQKKETKKTIAKMAPVFLNGRFFGSNAK